MFFLFLLKYAIGVMSLKLIEWLIKNIGTLKDLLWIVFTLIATVVAVLTYRRARLTFLQPLRSEVVKRQIDEMIKLLEFFNNNNLEETVDYKNILLGNFEIKMNELGFVDEKSKQALSHYKEMFVATAITKDTFDEDRYYRITPFFDPNKIGQKKKKTDYELLKEGIVKIHGIHLTKKYIDCMNELNKYLNSPIIPTRIKEKLELVIVDIQKNITDIIPMVIKSVILDANAKQEFHMTLIGVYSYFCEIMKKHNEQIQELQKEIRDYLKIDLKW